jgi:hypothetical protein
MKLIVVRPPDCAYINGRDRKPPVLDWAARCASEVVHQKAAVETLG